MSLSLVYQEKLAKIKYSSIAQLAERMTVNHDVAGSSPAGGAKRPILSVFFFIIKEKSKI